MPTTKVLLGWAGFHGLLWLLQVGIASVAGGVPDAPFAGTPIGALDISAIADLPPLVSVDFVFAAFGILRDLLQFFLGLLSFDYEILAPGHDASIALQLPAYILRGVGTLASGWMLLSATLVILGRA